MSEPKIQLVWKKIDELIPYENNAKLHPQEQIEKLIGSFDEFGRIVPAGIDRDGNLIYGHGRILAARQRGDTDFPCIEIDGLSETQRKAFVHADNLLAASGTDEALLRREMQALQAAGFDVSLTGYDPAGLSFGLEEPPITAEEDNYAPALPEEPRTQRGQVWQLGRHRLMCGDATSANDVQVLAGGAQIDLFLTDPPYNVDYEGGTGLKIENDNLAENEFKTLLCQAFHAADLVMRPGAAFYIWHADSNGLSFREACAKVWRVRQCLIWNKNSLVLGRQDYQWKHEPCLYGWKDGAGHYFEETRTETTVIPDAEEINPKKLSKSELVDLCKRLLESERPCTVIDEDRPSRSSEHPTMKPIKLLARLIRNSSRPGDLVLDTFGGSGSTLIACEQLKRSCCMMELDPRYCDVIVDRWESFTGEKAVLLDV